MTESPQTQPHWSADAKPRVLIIDDSVDVHRLLSARLRTEGIELVSAFTGEEGLRLAADPTVLPSLVLLDMDMPGLHGLSVLQALKADNATLEIPVIVVSGNQMAQDKVRAFDLGAVDYVTKPFEMTELRVRVRQALRMRQLIQMLGQRAQIDGLTGLWNRSFFNQRWGEEYARAARYGHPLSVAMADVDHFKSINDTYGHAAGDMVLQGVGKVLLRECRQHDLVCRYGGEEFVIVMPETSAPDAASVCERIRVSLERERWPRHPDRIVTASIGVAGSCGGVTITPDQWIEVADGNLYGAKRSGRNRVIWSDITAQGAVPSAVAA
jgi:diguanylate cyclase (GGDEF)-like protein